jgi:hypothetical protein
MAASQTKWFFEADYLQACSCDYGCPCEFEAPPSEGFCQGMGAWKINRGKYGDVTLDGLALAFCAHTPEEMYKGNGTGIYFIDQLADKAQRAALEEIARGRAGGMPFEIFAMVLSTVLEPQFVPFEFRLNGRNSSVTIGSALAMNFEPIKNPVNGEPEQIRVEHGTGFIFKSAEVVSAKECKSSIPGAKVLNFSWPSKAGFVTQVKYGN